MRSNDTAAALLACASALAGCNKLFGLDEPSQLGGDGAPADDAMADAIAGDDAMPDDAMPDDTMGDATTGDDAVADAAWPPDAPRPFCMTSSGLHDEDCDDLGDTPDNCPHRFNPDQAFNVGESVGQACDPDPATPFRKLAFTGFDAGLPSDWSADMAAWTFANDEATPQITRAILTYTPTLSAFQRLHVEVKIERANPMAMSSTAIAVVHGNDRRTSCALVTDPAGSTTSIMLTVCNVDCVVFSTTLDMPSPAYRLELTVDPSGGTYCRVSDEAGAKTVGHTSFDAAAGARYVGIVAGPPVRLPYVFIAAGNESALALDAPKLPVRALPAHD